MTKQFRIAIAQLNPIMGDITGNLAKARQARQQAFESDLILFSELFIVGYPPEDLVLKPALQDEARAAIENFAKDTADGGPAILIGAPWVEDNKLYNAFLLLDHGTIEGKTYKYDLPNYGVFDEKRVFAQGPLPKPFLIRGISVGLPICEDIWTPKVVECLAKSGSEIILVANGSPFEAGKEKIRLDLIAQRVEDSKCPIIYLNQVGGQDELVFDGASFAINSNGKFAIKLPPFEERVVITNWNRAGDHWTCEPGELWEGESRLSSVYSALLLGIRDYVNKNRFQGVVIGLSGGVDSALSAALAVDALGAERVQCVMMPSRYTSHESINDAQECASLLGVRLETISIEPAVLAFTEMFGQMFEGMALDATEENIQSRVRGLMLMAISNKFGPMVLTTGNKSEMSVGYATLYGDMCGGFNALKDVYKTDIYELANWRNANLANGALGPKGNVIPENIIIRAPTAELRANQLDQDSLPPYPVLDGILECLIEKEMSYEEILAKGYDSSVIKRIEHLLYLSEYKRRQSAPGVKITARNFGRDRRYPITNAFRDAI